MSLREKKKIETKNNIFEVAGRLFKEKGFESTSIDEITEEAGIGKGTFFNYFPTKEALLVYFGEQRDEIIYSLIGNELATVCSTRDKIKKVLAFLAENYEKDKELTKLLVFEYIKYIRFTDLKSDEDKKRRYRLIKIISDLLEEGVREGDVRSTIDVKKTTEILTAIYLFSLMAWLKPESDYSFAMDISEKIDMVFKGIGS
ncbi:MAG: TetR/AcrR family transcriptional regulator [Candidatus Methanoperedens sp.]|nr:TetR/AcrR family transcriptional regulator [Candidatus Methanoperedens sp.]